MKKSHLKLIYIAEEISTCTEFMLTISQKKRKRQKRAFQLQKCHFCRMCREDNREYKKVSLTISLSLAEETQSKASK